MKPINFANHSGYRYYSKFITASGVITFFLIMAFLSLSCSKDNDTGPKHPCDTIEVTFSGVIQPLLQQNCFECHGDGSTRGDVILDTYEDVNEIVLDGRLYGAVNHLAGYSAMPYFRDQLDSCSLYFINKWIEEGAPDN